MIKSTKALFSQILLFIMCFALFCFMPGCGGSGSGGGETAEGLTYTLTLTTTPAVDTFEAGETVTITATVTGSDGLPASGYAVTFTVFRNNSGGTLTIAGTGATDGDGRAQATYTLGSNDITEAVTDTIEVSIPGSSETLTINRAAKSYSMVVSADRTSLATREVATITATLTDNDGPVSGQAVSFVISTNMSGGTIAIEGTGTTDDNGQVVARYTVGPTTSTIIGSIQDVIDVSALNITQSITITQLSQTTVSVADIDLAATPTSIKTDGTSTSTITVNALTAGNALIDGASVALSANTGLLSAATVTTPGTVTFSSGGSNKVGNKYNRVATITATSGGITTSLLVRINGSTLELTSSATSLSVGGQATLTVIAKDAAGNAIEGAPVTLTPSAPNNVVMKTNADWVSGPVSGTTDANGMVTATLAAVAASSSPVMIDVTSEVIGPNPAATTSITINPSATQVFEILKTTRYTYLGAKLETIDRPDLVNLAAMQFTSTTSDTLEVEINVPSGNLVTFATTMGNWTVSGTKVQNVTVDAVTRKATATLTTNSQAGIANIQVYLTSAPATSDAMAVAITSATPDHISVQPSPTVISTSVGTTTGISVLLASVRDSDDQPVGGAPVLFEIVKGSNTGGGETISPVVVFSAAQTTGGLHLGDARTTFTSGSLESSSKGVQVRASVIGYDIHTGESEDKNDDGIITHPSADSGYDASIVITERAASIAFGQATEAKVDDTNSNYIQEMSVIVTDITGKGINGATVTLSAWPIAWNTGAGCTFDCDGFMWNPSTFACDIVCPKCGTFWNEDFRNENVWLDNGEDGLRCYYADPTGTDCIGGGKVNGSLTPPSAAAGTVVSFVEGQPITTDANGVAGFKLIYPKQSALHTKVRLRASTKLVQGTEIVNQTNFWLKALDSDLDPCRITNFYEF